MYVPNKWHKIEENWESLLTLTSCVLPMSFQTVESLLHFFLSTIENQVICKWQKNDIILKMIFLTVKIFENDACWSYIEGCEQLGDYLCFKHLRLYFIACICQKTCSSVGLISEVILDLKIAWSISGSLLRIQVWVFPTWKLRKHSSEGLSYGRCIQSSGHPFKKPVRNLFWTNLFLMERYFTICSILFVFFLNYSSSFSYQTIVLIVAIPWFRSLRDGHLTV